MRNVDKKFIDLEFKFEEFPSFTLLHAAERAWPRGASLEVNFGKGLVEIGGGSSAAGIIFDFELKKKRLMTVKH